MSRPMPRKEPLQELLNEAATFGMLRRIYEADPKMNETTQCLIRTVFASYYDDEGIKHPH
jgi:hypothetical protein